MNHNELLLAFYGDDFTGSTDAMEALARSGYRTVLFLEAPSLDRLKKFEGLRCIGVAGTSRAKSSEDMETELRPVFEKLSMSGAPLVHYKTCSTFDSSPEVGSIGRAIGVARDYFPDQVTVPLLVGAPRLGRYTLFGQHFAKMQDTVYRLDRHPVMSQHPSTPMHEADLRLHLAAQTADTIALMDIVELDGDQDAVLGRYRDKLGEKPGILLFDALDEDRLKLCGQLIQDKPEGAGAFVVGSSGVEYALAAHWDELGLASPSLENSTAKAPVRPTDTILVVSGSASPVSRLQIERAIAAGFRGIRITPDVIEDTHDTAQSELVQQAVDILAEGQSVVLYTALGPEDEAIGETRTRLKAMGLIGAEAGEFIGRSLGKLTKRVMDHARLRRIVVAGGDTSGFVTSEMGAYGLEMIWDISPGAPLCRVYSDDAGLDGLELALKGGQLGSPDYFIKVRDAGFPEPDQ
jgi:3-oxoisoapionate kinase